MQLFITAFLCGLTLLLGLPLSLVPALLIMLAAAFFYPLPKSLKIILLGLALGLGHGYWHIKMLGTQRVSQNKENKPIPIIGEVDSSISTEQNLTHFIFAFTAPYTSKAKIYWQNAPVNLMRGDRCQFTVKLKNIYSQINPGSYDFERWAFTEGVLITGYVQTKFAAKCRHQGIRKFSLTDVRQNIQQGLDESLLQKPLSPWILALLTGNREGLSQEDWAVLQKTGTNHLIAIAGLHLGIIFSICYFVARKIWSQSSRLILLCPTPLAANLIAYVVALFYAVLAGLAIPAQRVSIMLTIYLIAKLSRREFNLWRVWYLSIFFILLVNPFDFLTISFWLSFGTVGIILYAQQKQTSQNKLAQGLHMQWIISIGLLPLSLFFFSSYAMYGFIANVLTIPIVGYVILPGLLCVLIALTVNHTLAIYLVGFINKVLAIVWGILLYISTLPGNVYYASDLALYIFLLTLVAVLLMLLPKGMPGRWSAVIFLLPLLLSHAKTIMPGEFEVAVLDIGQGLSTVVRTRKHILVFDTGGKMSAASDKGATILVPYLHTLQVKNIDKLVISHADNDHIGGSDSLLKTFPVKTILTSVPEKFADTELAKYPFQKPIVNLCLAGLHWQWDGVNFEFLYPLPTQLHLNNDSSCVLKIWHDQHAILLTGDIEKYAEKNVVALSKAKLAATVLIAPHHGSKTSMLDAFIEAVHPAQVVFSVGYLNRYHFPNIKVIEKYKNLQIQTFDTVHSGALIYTFNTNTAAPVPLEYRRLHHYFWQVQ